MNGSKKMVQEEGDVAIDVIHAYSRAQAIADSLLVDASEMAREAGLRYPVALTHAVYEQYVRVPEGVTGQDEEGRLWDILWMLYCGIRATPEPKVDSPLRVAYQTQYGSVLHFELLVRNDNRSPKLVELKAICGPGDDPAPVITVMLPDED